MKTTFRLIKTKTGAASVAVGSMLMFGVGSANAELSPSIAPGITEVQTDGLAMIDLIWPVLIALTVGFKIMGIFKKGVAKV